MPVCVYIESKCDVWHIQLGFEYVNGKYVFYVACNCVCEREEYHTAWDVSVVSTCVYLRILYMSLHTERGTC